jgi:peptide-methionine (R)-S-oxide reductase
MVEKIEKSDEEWRRALTPEQYHVCRQHGTERAFTGKYNDFKGKGTFVCVCCGNPLFRSDAKFDSGTGWPSFFQPVSADAVSLHVDRSFMMRRVEVRCARCDSHLGHVFDDGPRPTGQRFCMNSVALDFKPDEGAASG